MFTGIITEIGEVVSLEGGRLRMRAGFAPSALAIGSSVACDGCCLTVITIEAHDGGSVFAADVSNETLARTTLGEWSAGRAVNLEPALNAGDELGGHIVTGHIDDTAAIIAADRDGSSVRFSVEMAPALAPFIAVKGSVALDGTSLTVNAAGVDRFEVNLIPHSLTATTWGRKKPGDRINIEVDLIARYVARSLEFRA